MDTPHERTVAPLLGEPLPVELMNTIWADRAGVHDALTTTDEVLAWLRAVGARLDEVAPGMTARVADEWPGQLGVTAHALGQLRDALRRLTAEQTDDPRGRAASAIADRTAALEVVNAAVAASPSWPALLWPVDHEAEAVWRFAEPAGLACVSVLASQFVRLLSDDPGLELRACLAPGCVLYFAKDRTRREWCSTGCGNRARAARHYEKKRSSKS